MNLYWIASAISLAVILLIYNLASKNIRKTKTTKAFRYLLIVAMALIAVDITWIFSESNILNLPMWIDYILAPLYYTLTGGAAFCCYLYSERVQLINNKPNNKVVSVLLNIPFAVLAVLSFVSIGTGWMFTIGEDGVHTRGSLYFVQPIISLIYLLLPGIKAIYNTFKQKNPYNKNRYLSITIYCFTIIVFAVFQVFEGSFAFLNVGMMLSTVHAFFFINTFEREQFTNYSKIKSFSKLFLSAYYVDMNERTLERIDIADHIKNSVDYYENKQQHIRPYDKALNYYVNKFVHPNDKDTVREMTALDYIEEHISNKEPYYSITYRQVIGEVCKWYRMYVILTSMLDKNELGNVIICVMDVNDEQKLVAKSSYYKDMLTNTVAATYVKIMQVNVDRDKVYDLKIIDDKITKFETGRNIEQHLEHFTKNVAPEYKDMVLSNCRNIIEKGNKGDTISYGDKGLSSSNSDEYSWYVTTIRSMEYEGDRLLLIFVADNTDKLKTFELLEEKRHTESMNQFVVNVLSSAVEFRSMETGDHVNRVTALTRVILSELMRKYPEYEITEHAANQIANAAALHDVGKIAIPDHILLKPGKLTAEEYEEMKKHTVYGCDFLSRFEDKNDSFYRYCYDICMYHHERYDGKGYPKGLVGEEIPIWAQIVSIIDVYDALISARTYKPAYSSEEAVKMINNGECGVFSPKILDCFNSVLSATGVVDVESVLSKKTDL